eukprot:878607_1
MNGNMHYQEKTVSQRLKNFDYHTTVASEFRVKTSNGALLSVATLLLILYLILTEFQYNLTPSLRERVHVNATTPAGIEMEFDVTFHNVACALVNVDAGDPLGQPQSMHIDRTHRVFKHRMDKNGRFVGKKSKFELGNTFQAEEHIGEYAEKIDMEFAKDEDDYYYDNECGSCYGAGDQDECCNTCDDVKRAYQRKGWLFPKDLDVKQCKQQKNSHDMEGEGCNVHGIVALSSGGGNLHLAPGHDLENFGKQVLFSSLEDFINQAFETFDVSHKVNKLRFGKTYPGEYHQLDGEERKIEDAYGMYQYYIKIVPTVYKFLNGTTVETNQYSVTEHMRHVSPGSSRGLPGIFFYYEVIALHVEIV